MHNRLIEVNKINKIYLNRHVLKDISFSIDSGKIYGLIGENGAGKTTLIRILSGLIKKNNGTIRGLSQINISSIVESPALHLNLSAVDNLKYQLLLCGCECSRDKINEVLNLVGLSNINLKKKVRDYSLGMRQRLAIGMSIVDLPNLLILDEPINGLDPKGVKDIRKILFTLRDEYNMTILISSHILAELDLLADNYIIMSKGEVVKVISNEEVKSSLERKIILNSNPYSYALEVLIREGISCKLNNSEIEISDSQLNITQIIDLLRRHDIEINEIYSKHISFEEYYLDLIERRTNG